MTLYAMSSQVLCQGTGGGQSRSGAQGSEGTLRVGTCVLSVITCPGREGAGRAESLQFGIHTGPLASPGAWWPSFQGMAVGIPEARPKSLKACHHPRGIPAEGLKRACHQNRRDCKYSLLGPRKGSQMKCEEVSESREETRKPFQKFYLWEETLARGSRPCCKK